MERTRWEVVRSGGELDFWKCGEIDENERGYTGQPAKWKFLKVMIRFFYIFSKTLTPSE